MADGEDTRVGVLGHWHLDSVTAAWTEGKNMFWTSECEDFAAEMREAVPQ